MKNLAGRKVKGFKFDKDNVYDYTFDRKVGEVGRIAGVFNGWCTVHFVDDILVYPLDQIEEHLVPEEMYNNFEGWFCGDFPINYEIGKEYEFSDGGAVWFKRKLLAIIDHEFKYVVESRHGSFAGYRKIREIKEQKETKIIYCNNRGERVTLTIQGEVLEIEEIKIKK